MNLKNILILSAVFPPEPVVSAKLSYELAVFLSEKDKVIVISPRPTRPFGFKFEKKTQNEKYKHFQLNSFTCPESNLFGRLRESYSFGKYCNQYIHQNSKDIKIIYANTWPLLAQYFTVSAAKKFKIPVIIHVQDIYPESLSNRIPIFSTVLNFILLPIDKYVLHSATKIIAISNNMKNYLVKTRKIEKEKIIVVQNWQDEIAFIAYSLSNKLEVINNKPFTFMYLGNIGPVAGVDLLLEAFSETNLNNSRLVIAGSGSMKVTLQRKVIELNLKSIEFWDVPDGKVPEIQDQADVMLLPIKKGAASSSIPSKLPAYMFSKKPILACVDQDCDTAMVINVAECGWVLAPENISSLSEMMQKVASISNEELLKKGKNGFIYALENLSKRNNLEKVVKCITDTIV